MTDSQRELIEQAFDNRGELSPTNAPAEIRDAVERTAGSSRIM